MFKKVGVIACVVLSFVLTCLCACGWKTRQVYRSPDGEAEVLVLQPSAPWMTGMSVAVRSRGKEKLFHRSRGDDFFTATEVYWSDDGRLVGVFICNELVLRLAVYRGNLEEAPFTSVERVLETNIRARYDVPSEESAFEWLCGSAGGEEFRRTFGDATLPQRGR